jgi:hypothetical protein
LREIPDRGRKDRLHLQAGHANDLGDVLVMLRQRIQEEIGRKAVFKFRDHRIAAAGIARHGIDRQSLVRRDQPRAISGRIIAIAPVA